MNAKHKIVRRPGGLRVITVTLNRRKVKRVKRLEVDTFDQGLTPGDALCRSDGKIARVAEAWAELEHATLNEHTWWMLLLVLVESTAAAVTCLEPAPRLHPTKAVDLRRWLCDPQALEEVCGQFREVGVKAMLTSKYESCRIAARKLFPEGRVHDPFLWVNHRTVGPFGAAMALTGVQCERVLPWLKRTAWGEVAPLVARWEALHRASPATAWIVLSRSAPESISTWVELFHKKGKPGSWEDDLRSWLENGGPELKLTPEWAELLPEALHVGSHEKNAGLWYLRDAQRAGSDIARVRGALSLWTIYGWGRGPLHQGRGGDCSALVEQVCRRVKVPKRQRACAWRLFEKMGTTPECEPFLRLMLASNCSSLVFDRLLELVMRAPVTRADTQLMWGRLVDGFADLCAFLKHVPPAYVDKASTLLDELFWKSAQPAPDLKEYLILIAQQCRKPLSVEDDSEILAALLKIDSENTLRALAAMPENTWGRYDGACRSWRREEMIAAGVRRLSGVTMPLVLAGMEHRPRRTFKVLETLGAHPRQAVGKILEGVVHHPLFGLCLTLENHAEHFDLLAHALDRSARDPLAKLREIHAGRRQYRSDVVLKILTTLNGQIVEVLLDWLEHECAEDFKRQSHGFGGELESHTLRLLADIDENKRAFRRLLRGYARGGDGAVWSHRRNSEWLAKNRDIVSRGWLQHHDLTIEAGEEGDLTLFIEQRFEQVLKMGTAVDSCLAIGGCNSHSAVANAADANKQVVVAYDKEGRFVARQLIAISEEHRLVCFEVYSRRSWAEVEKAFAAYDRHLAERLGLSVESDSEYTIAPLVCRDWYDDCNWNPLKIDPPGRILKVNPPTSSLELSF